MKTLSIILSAALCGCGTTVYQNGKPVIRIEGDCKNLNFRCLPSGECTLAGDITHSTVIAAGGVATQQILIASAPVITATGLPRMIK